MSQSQVRRSGELAVYGDYGNGFLSVGSPPNDLGEAIRRVEYLVNNDGYEKAEVRRGDTVVYQATAE